MALSPEQKAEILTMHQSGMDPRQIAAYAAERFGCKPIAVHGLLNQEKWKADPSSRPKNVGRPKKVEEITKKTSYEDAPEIPIGQAGAGQYSASPLFAGVPGMIDRVEVIRVHAMPRHAGMGVVGEIDPEATASDLQSIHGGGRYQLKAYDSRGVLVRTKSVTLAGRSIPVDPEFADGNAPFYMPDNSGGPMAAMVAQLQQQIIAMSTRERDDDRMTFEQRLSLERERMKADVEMRDRAHQQSMQLQNQANQQMLSIVMAATNAKQGGMAETLQLLTTAKDLFGDGGGGESDAVTEAIKNGPKMLEGLGMLMRSKGNAAPAAPGQPAVQPGGITLDDAGRRFYEELTSKGLTHEEAMAELMKVGDYLTKRIEAKKLTQKPAAAKGAPVPPMASGPAIPKQTVQPQPNGNGQAHAPAGVPAQGVPPTVTSPKVEA